MVYGPGWAKVHDRAIKRDGFKCSECGKDKNLRVHHVKPVCYGGSDSLDNLITLCQKCHVSKHISNRNSTISFKVQDATAQRIRIFLIKTHRSSRYLGKFLEELITRELDAKENLAEKGNSNEIPCQA